MAASTKQRRVLTGIKPTGVPHIGNYLGAIQPALALAQEHEAFLFIADLHAMTARQDPGQLRRQTICVAATWLALGLDPERTVFYKQSDVPEIPMLAWTLACVTPLGLLNRAHSFKAALQEGQGEEDINVGLFTYPVLMAADILLFDTDVVPVGKDQKQHLEITQEAARKMNLAYGEGLLKVPEALIDEAVMTVPGLDGRKMSKSYDNTIEIFAEPKELVKRVKLIKTDSTPYGAALHPETIFELHRLLARPEDTARLSEQYRAGRKDPGRPDAAFDPPSQNYFGWGDAKKALVEALSSRFEAARGEYARLMADPAHVEQLLARGAERARAVAAPVLQRVMDAVGFVPPAFLPRKDVS